MKDAKTVKARNRPELKMGIFLPYQWRWITDRSAIKIMEKSRQINGVNVVVFDTAIDPVMLKNAAFMLQKEASNMVVAGAFEYEGRPQLLLMYSPDLVEAGHNASKDIKEAAKAIQGGGGGQPGLASAGGKNSAGLGEALHTMLELATK